MNKMLNCDCGNMMQPWSYTLLRVVLGGIFLVHGYTKVFTMGVDAVASFFASVGIPAAAFVATVVSYGELIAGVLIILGIFTHWAAKFASIVLIGAIYFVHWQNGANVAAGGYEYALMLLVVSIYIMSHGDGDHTARRFIGR